MLCLRLTSHKKTSGQSSPDDFRVLCYSFPKPTKCQTFTEVGL